MSVLVCACVFYIMWNIGLSTIHVGCRLEKSSINEKIKLHKCITLIDYEHKLCGLRLPRMSMYVIKNSLSKIFL